MKPIKNLFFALLFLGLQSQLLFASDWELWTKYSFNFKLNKQIDFKVEPELRYKHEFGHFYYEQVYVGPVFKLKKWLKIATLYDYKTSEKNHTWKNEDLGVFDIELNSPFLVDSTFNYRLRNERNFTKKEWVQRNNFKISKEYKKIKGLSFFMGDETFYNFDSDRMDENRTTVGFSQKINNNLSCGLSYILRYKKAVDWSSSNILQIDIGAKF